MAGPNKSLKQLIQIELKRVKNPNWQEVNQLAIYKHGRGFERGIAVKKSSKWPERGLELGAGSELQALRSNRSATLPS